MSSHIVQNQNDEDLVKITASTKNDNGFWIIIHAIWSGYYLRDWFKLVNEDYESTKTYTSHLLFGYMLCVFWSLLNGIKKYYVDSKLEGQTLTNKRYDSELHFNSQIFRIVSNLIKNAFEIIMILMTFQFIPFTHHNCYGYTQNMCINGRVGAFFGIIMIIIIFVVVLGLILMCCTGIIQPSTFRRGISQAQRIPVLNQLSVLQHLTLFNEECAICIQNGTESSDPNFVTLPCDHKFHDTCMKQWLLTGNSLTCPMCRSPITQEMEQNVNQNV